jgi:hypothetical protein
VAAALVLNVVFLALGGICLPPVALVGKVICFMQIADVHSRRMGMYFN